MIKREEKTPYVNDNECVESCSKLETPKFNNDGKCVELCSKIETLEFNNESTCVESCSKLKPAKFNTNGVCEVSFPKGHMANEKEDTCINCYCIHHLLIIMVYTMEIVQADIKKTLRENVLS